MDERLRILKLLEERKITVEEATRLLETLSEEKKGREETQGSVFKMVREIISETIGMIPHIIESAFHTAGMGFKSGVIESEFDATKLEKLVLKFAGGDVEIKGLKKDIVKIYGGGIVKTHRSDGALISKFAGGDVKVEIPSDLKLELSFAGGDIELIDVEGDIKIRSTGGDSKLVLKDIKNVDIELKGGDLWIEIPEDSSFSFEIKTDFGKINVPENLKFAEKKNDYVKGIYGDEPKGNLYVRGKYGDVVLKFRK